MAVTATTNDPAQLLTPPPRPAAAAPTASAPAPQAQNTPPPQNTPPAPPLPTQSPIQLLDWQGGLQAGQQDATTRDVGNNELVQNQLNNITAQGSQYLTQAADRAREEASNRGMMMSTMAAGAGSRSAIDAALPIAQQDAAQYGHVADINMAARNTNSLAQQQMYGQLLGQSVGIRANLDESERARGFTAQQTLQNQQWQTAERIGTEAWQGQQQQMQNAWQGAQNNAQLQSQLKIQELQIAHDSAMRLLDEHFQGSQLDKQMAQQRFQDFTNAMGAQTQELSQTISSIYQNPNLNAGQQAAAVANARAVYQSLFNSYAASLAGGIPKIFWTPYPMTGTPKPPPQVLPPPQLPPGGYTGGGGGGHA